MWDGQDVTEDREGFRMASSFADALRKTRAFVEAGIFAAKPDPRDGCNLLIAPTAPAAERIRAYLTAALEIASPAA